MSCRRFIRCDVSLLPLALAFSDATIMDRHFSFVEITHMRLNYARVVGAGIAGTLVMTALGLWIGPAMGLPRMNPAEMLASKMGGVAILGWLGHLMIGIILALIYSSFVASRLPGPPAVRGAVFSLAPWLMAQLVVLPMMGMPLFSGSMPMAVGSLIGHLVYGAVVGGIVGDPALQEVKRD